MMNKENINLGLWQTTKRTEVFVAEPWIRVFLQEVCLPDGKIIDDYYRIDLLDYVIIVARTIDGKMVLGRQYKQGVGKVSLLLPGGAIKDGETPLLAAQREFMEETGYEAENWQSFGCFVCNANYGCGKAHLFLAKNAKRVAQPDSDDLEDTEIVLMKPGDVINAVCGREMVAMGAVMAIAIALNPEFANKWGKYD